MGCSSSTAAMDAIIDQPVKKVDPKLPFDHYRQLFNWRNTWKAVTRTMETTSVDMFIRYNDYSLLVVCFHILHLTEVKFCNDSVDCNLAYATIVCPAI